MYYKRMLPPIPPRLVVVQTRHKRKCHPYFKKTAFRYYALQELTRIQLKERSITYSFICLDRAAVYSSVVAVENLPMVNF